MRDLAATQNLLHNLDRGVHEFEGFVRGIAVGLRRRGPNLGILQAIDFRDAAAAHGVKPLRAKCDE
jgi:hypothetical protein